MGGRGSCVGEVGIEGSAAVSCSATGIDLFVNVFHSAASFAGAFSVFWRVVFENIESDLVAVIAVFVFVIDDRR